MEDLCASMPITVMSVPFAEIRDGSPVPGILT